MKYTSAGYRVFASNKSAEKNSVTVSVIGFSSTAQRDASFEVKGILKGAAVDDFNNDGFPDLVMHIYNGKAAEMGSIIGIASDKNESIRPIYFPDILDDAKLRSGYKGNDKFKLIEGTLMRSFPVFDVTDTSATKPLGIVRHIQYRVFTAENNVLKFKVLRTYETKL
ncbi:MAG: hypothetical protein H7101_12525 [Deinococcales bacterium]|nr:hypothetical protein [Chitinophagaceae bacterium]